MTSHFGGDALVVIHIGIVFVILKVFRTKKVNAVLVAGKFLFKLLVFKITVFENLPATASSGFRILLTSAQFFIEANQQQ